MTEIGIRRLSADDSFEALTSIVRRAIDPLVQRNLNCTWLDRSTEPARQRLRRGDCFVAVVSGKIVGTITVHAADRTLSPPRCDGSTVACVGQIAVDPSHQGTGVGRALLRTAELWARSRQYLEIVVEVPEPARRLRGYLGRCGFRPTGTVQFEGKACRNVVLSKPIHRPVRAAWTDSWPARHPAEMAALIRAAHGQTRLRRVPAM
jgi:GNAT superfamily N-acetyltransferase